MTCKNLVLTNRGPRLGFWGITAGSAVVFFAEPVPRLRKDIYSKIPVLGNYELWQTYKDWGF
jgi:hypothetical protein